MIIPLHTDGGKVEYFLVELQGKLEATHADSLDGLRVGDFEVAGVRLAWRRGARGI